MDKLRTGVRLPKKQCMLFLLLMNSVNTIFTMPSPSSSSRLLINHPFDTDLIPLYNRQDLEGLLKSGDQKTKKIVEAELSRRNVRELEAQARKKAEQKRYAGTIARGYVGVLACAALAKAVKSCPIV